MAEVLDAPLYVVHVTCRDSLSQVREARRRGSRVWAETCPQYLYLTKDDLTRSGFAGAKYVCSPPLREFADQEALWAGLRDGDLQVVSTDHCPFLYETQKTLGRDDFSLIPNGVPGIEERLSLLHEGGVNGGYLTLERFVALTAANPARLFGLEGRKGAIAPGYDADIAMWNMEVDRTLGLATSHSAVDYNLYEGMRVRGVPEMVLRRGQVIVRGEDFLGEAGSGRYLHRATMGIAESRPVML
jgi:dihydropyrimidinase